MCTPCQQQTILQDFKAATVPILLEKSCLTWRQLLEGWRQSEGTGKFPFTEWSIIIPRKKQNPLKSQWKTTLEGSSTTHPSLSVLRTHGITHTSLHQFCCTWAKEFAFGKKLLPMKPPCCLILPSLLQYLQLVNELGCCVLLINCVTSHLPGAFQE